MAHPQLLSNAVANLSFETRSKESKFSTPLRANFPLPRELRDQVYGYLLMADHVKAPSLRDKRGVSTVPSDPPWREVSTAHTYRFETNILGVNKQINHEATQTLAENHFVVVSYEWRFFPRLVHLTDTPVVCDDYNSVSKVKLHYLRLHLTHPRKDSRGKLGCHLMIAQDLPRLTTAVQWQWLQFASPEFNFFNKASMPNGKPGISKVREDIPVMTTKVQLRSPAARALTPALELALLTPLKSMIIGMQNVTIKGGIDKAIADDVKSTMGPRYTSLLPMAWKTYEIARIQKARADSLVSSDNFDLVMSKLHLLTFGSDSYVVCRVPSEPLSSDAQLPIALVACTVIDANLMECFLSLRMGDIQRAGVAQHRLAELFKLLATIPSITTILPGPVGSLPSVLCAKWLRLILEIVRERKASLIPAIASALRDIRASMGDSPYAAMVGHDIQVLAFPKQGQVLKWYEPPASRVPDAEFIKELSVSSFDLPVINTHIAQAPAVLPRFEGFLEAAHKKWADARCKELFRERGGRVG